MGGHEVRPPPLLPPCFNEVSQEEKDQHHILTHIYGIWYRQSYVQGSNGDTDIKNRLLDSVGEGEGGMIWENSIETYVSPCVRSIIRASLMHDAGHLKLVLCDNLDGWGGEGGGSGFRREGSRVCLWLICTDIWKKPPQYCKVIVLPLK